jgi:Ras-related protein Rab-1A
MITIPLLKVVILGDGNVGKTSLVRRYCEGKFEDSRTMTIGVDFQTKVVELPEMTVKLSIWDVAGQARFQIVRESFYRGSLAAALVYDRSDPTSLAHLPDWVAEIRKFVPEIPFVVIANKSDLIPGQDDSVGQLAASQIPAGFIVTSALTGEGVENMFKAIATLAIGRMTQ